MTDTDLRNRVIPIEEYSYDRILKTSEEIELKLYLDKKYNIYGHWFTRSINWLKIRLYKAIGD